MYYVRLFLNSEILYVTLCRRVLRSNGVSHRYHVQNDTAWQLMYCSHRLSTKWQVKKNPYESRHPKSLAVLWINYTFWLLIGVHMRASLPATQSQQRCEAQCKTNKLSILILKNHLLAYFNDLSLSLRLNLTHKNYQSKKCPVHLLEIYIL